MNSATTQPAGTEGETSGTAALRLKNRQKRPFGRTVLFVAALVTAGLSLILMRTRDFFQFQMPDSLQWFRPYFTNYREMLIGGTVFLAANAVAALALFRPREKPLDTCLTLPRLRWDRTGLIALGAGLASQISLDLLLYSHRYSHGFIPLFFGGTILIAIGIDRCFRSSESQPGPFTRLDLSIALALGLSAIGLNCIALTRWNFAWIGDEKAFYNIANQIVQGKAWNIFDLTGVYNTHPWMDSAWQALALKLFGNDIVGWRMGSAAVMGIATTLFYLLALTLAGRLPAVCGAVIVASSHHLMAFTRISYNNTHCLVWSQLALLMLALAWRTRGTGYLFGTGCALGMCLYTFMPAQVTGPVIAILIMIPFLRRPRWGTLAAWAVLTAGFLLTITPGLLTTPIEELWRVMQQNSRREAAAQDPGMVFRLNVVRSLGVYWSNFQWKHHYVAGPFIDTISGLLLGLGLPLALFRIHRPAERLALIWFVVGLVVLAGSFYLPEPPITRLLYLVPAIALLAGLALASVDSLMKRWSIPRKIRRTLFCVLMIPIPFLNLHQFLKVSPRSTPMNKKIMAMKALTEHPEYTFVFVSPNRYDTHLMELLGLYPRFQGRYQFSLLSNIDETLFPSGDAGLYPVYFTAEASTAETLLRMLPAHYRKIQDRDPARAFQVWLLVPGGSPSADSADSEAKPLRLQFVREIQFERTSDPLGIQPIDVSVDSKGNVYIATNRDGKIRKYNPEGNLLLTWGNTDSNRKVFVDLFGIAVGPRDIVYAIDAGTSTIHRFTASGQRAGSIIPGVGYATRGLGIDPAGNLLVADTGSGRIARYSPEGTLIEHFHRNGIKPGEFLEPIDVGVNSGGEWFVMDAGNRRIQKLDPGGAFLDAWEIPSEVTARDGGHLALDSKGRLFITRPATIETGDLVVFDHRGNKLARLFEPHLTAPTGVFVDGSGLLYVTFPRSDVVRIYRVL